MPAGDPGNGIAAHEGRVIAYRTNPGPLAKLAPRAPWWRLAGAWVRGPFGRMARRARRLDWNHGAAGVEPTWYPPVPTRGTHSGGPC